MLTTGGVLAAALLSRAPRGAAPRPDAAVPVTWTRTIEIASGEAVLGPWHMNASAWRYLDDPTVAVDAHGFIGVAWADQAQKDLFFQLYRPDGTPQLEQPANVSRTPAVFSWLPRLAITSGDPRRVYLLWQEIVFSGGTHGGEIFFTRSTDGGRSFSEPLNLSNTRAGDGKGRLTRDYWHNGSLDLAVGPDGVLYAAWTEYEGALWLSRSTDAGERFAAPRRIARGRSDPARGPTLAVDREGRVYLAWTVGEDAEADVRMAVSDDGGRSFREPRVLFQRGGHADAPKIAVDRTGTLHLVYAESPSGLLRGYHIRYTRSVDGGRTFEAPREISGPHAAQFESVNFPALSVDRRGGLYVAWELFPDAHDRPRGLGFVYSTDGGRTFSPPSVVPGTVGAERGVNGSLQGLLMRKLAVSDEGTIALVNSTIQRNRDSRITLFLGRTSRP